MKKQQTRNKQPAPPQQGRRPDQPEKAMQIIEWLLFGIVFAGFAALMWKLGTLTWNFFSNLF